MQQSLIRPLIVGPFHLLRTAPPAGWEPRPAVGVVPIRFTSSGSTGSLPSATTGAGVTLHSNYFVDDIAAMHLELANLAYVGDVVKHNIDFAPAAPGRARTTC